MSIYALCLPQVKYRELFRACLESERTTLFGSRPYAFLGPMEYRTLGGDPENERYRPRTINAVAPRSIRLTPALQERCDTSFISPPREFGTRAAKRTRESRIRSLAKLPVWVQTLVKEDEIGGWVDEGSNATPTRLFKYEGPGGSGRAQRWNVLLLKGGKYPRANEQLILVVPRDDRKTQDSGTVLRFLVSGNPNTKGTKRTKTASLILFPN